MADTLQESNSGSLSLLDILPLDVIRLLIIESRNPTVFRVCKLFMKYSDEEEFWKNYSKEVTNNAYPPSHYNDDMRLHAISPRPFSWKSYVQSRLKYDKMWTQPATGANRKRIMVNLHYNLSQFF